MLVAVFHFKKVSQHAGRCTSTLQRARGKQLAHRLGGIAMFGDDGFQRTALAHEAGVLATQGIEMALGFGFGRALLVQLHAGVGDLRRQCADPL